MRARDQCSIFSTDGKFHPDYGLLLELHALIPVARSYAFFLQNQGLKFGYFGIPHCNILTSCIM